MKRLPQLAFLTSLLIFLIPVWSWAAGLAPGSIRLSKVSGAVQVVDVASGRQVEAKAGLTIGQGQTVVTGSNGTAVLLFSNGATVTITPNTSMSVDTFLQEPGNTGTVEFEKTADKARSQTNLKLNYGELVGQVKKLRSDSKFEVTSQVGVAGIRGTIFRIRFEIDATTGRKTMWVSNVDGTVVISKIDVEGLGELQEVPLGTQGIIEAQQDATNPEAITVVSVTITGLTESQKTAISELVVQEVTEQQRQQVEAIESVEGPVYEGSPDDIVSPYTTE